MPGIVFTDFIPTALNAAPSAAVYGPTGVSSTSPTLAAEVVTGLQISTGAFTGARFYLTDTQAISLSSAGFPCYGGWYRVVLVDAGATAANIGYGKIGAMVTVAKGVDTVTDAANVLSLGAVPVVFLGSVTPGQYTIVQDLSEGNVNLLVGSSQTIAIGSILVSTATGVLNLSAAISLADFITFVAMAEAAVTTLGAIATSAVAAPSGGVAVYTITSTAGYASNGAAGQYFVVSAYTTTNVPDNGTFLCTASTATTLTLSNANAVANSAVGSVTAIALVRARAGAPFARI